MQVFCGISQNVFTGLWSKGYSFCLISLKYFRFKIDPSDLKSTSRVTNVIIEKIFCKSSCSLVWYWDGFSPLC